MDCKLFVKKKCDVNIHFSKPHIFWTFTFCYVATLFMSLYVSSRSTFYSISWQNCAYILVNRQTNILCLGHKNNLVWFRKRLCFPIKCLVSPQQKRLWSCPILLSKISVFFKNKHGWKLSQGLLKTSCGYTLTNVKTQTWTAVTGLAAFLQLLHHTECEWDMAHLVEMLIW